MAGTALPGGLTTRRTWRSATLMERRVESSSAHTLVFEVEGWPEHLPGQHLDLRLTAEDGYQAARSYSLAAPSDGTRVEITVQRTTNGEVSPFLTDVLMVGDAVEVRGPIGGWFVWRAESAGAVLLIGGGSGIVPLMSMIRARPRDSMASFRLLYSVRMPHDRLYVDELEHHSAEATGVDVSWIYTRFTSDSGGRPAGRLSMTDLHEQGWPAKAEPSCYVCGPTAFVESAASLLLAAGHDESKIKTERFGGV
ncbi:MAG: ferredoxin reductase [Actinomycetes bacterium]